MNLFEAFYIPYILILFHFNGVNKYRSQNNERFIERFYILLCMVWNEFYNRYLNALSVRLT